MLICAFSIQGQAVRPLVDAQFKAHDTPFAMLRIQVEFQRVVFFTGGHIVNLPHLE